ncbi:hypothetical protein Tco_0488421 [Tanacetum coccineum]
MAEPNDYITATRKNFVSNDNEGRMVEKCIIEIQGIFLVKIRNDAFNGNDGENAYKHINKFLKIVGPIKINGLTQDQFRLSIFPVSLAGAAYEWFTKECIGSITTWDNMLEKFILKFHHLSNHNEEETEEDDNPNETDNVPKILRIKGNLFDFETPLWYDELVDGKLKDETLALKAKIEGSWGDATLGVLKFCKWLKSCFENFYEIEYEVLDLAETMICLVGLVKMDDPNITMKEYIRLKKEKARRRGKVYNWEIAKYVTLSCEPTVSPLNDNKIDFRISFDESDNEDYTVIYDKNSFSYKIISVDDLKTDSENDNDKVNMPSFSSSKPTVSYFNDLDFFKDFENEFPAIVYKDALTSKLDFLTEPTVSSQHIDEFNLRDETSSSKCDEEEQNILYFNDLFSFNVIFPDDSK